MNVASCRWIRRETVMKWWKLLAVWLVTMLLGAGQLFGSPAISSFSPNFGSSIDGYITIHGSGFWPGSLVVKFNGVRDYTAGVTTEIGEIVIKAQVPTNAPNGSNPIYVEVNGFYTYSAEDFTVIGSGPYITGFSPSIGGGGAAVTISGAHFENPLTVKFNGVTAPPTNTGSYTSFVVNAPAGVTTGPITVTTAFGTYTSVTNFHVPPGITGLSPAAGRAGTNVLITGSNFRDTTAVRFNGLDAASFNVLSNGAIQASVPANATTGQIRVIAPGGSAYSSGNFVVQPTITGFSPGFGPVGTSVTVTGANFNVGTPVVKFGSTTAGTPTGVSFNQLTVTVPSGATNGPITVTTTDGTATSAYFFYLPANIASFTPNNSAPGTTVKITGVNFIGATNVSFDGASVSFTVTNNTTIGATVPGGVTTGPIRVTTPAGTATSSGYFYGAPVITSFNPTHGLPGTNVTIVGVNFLGATAVRFNGTNAASFNITNNTTLRATVPTNAQTGPISVGAPAGTNTSAANFVLDYTANVAVSVIDLPDPVTLTSNLTYTIVVTNRGPFPAPGVTLSETLPASVVLKSAATTAGSLNTSTNPITGNFGQIDVSNSVIVTIIVSPQTEGTISNYVSVSNLYTDPNPANNTAVTFTTVEPFPLLSIRLVNTNWVQVSWPAALANYKLEFKPLLATNNFWSNVLTAPQTIGNESVVTETNVGAMKYYRLKK